MPRISRTELLYDGCYAHVFTRSINKKFIFEDEEDFKRIEFLFIEGKKAHHFQIYHYCIMHTHFHLALQMEDAEEFSKAMKWVKREYTRYYNKKYKRRGPLWQNRYKSLLIENEAYLHACGLYIEDNPVEVGLVSRREEWLYSSAKCYELGESSRIVSGYDREKYRDYAYEENDFESGVAIGSKYYRFQQQQM